MKKIQMVDLQGQYQKIKPEIDRALQEVLTEANFINGHQVNQFAEELSAYLQVPYVIPCANGTDALQIALMALGLQAGDEVITPAHTYIATVEVVALLGLKPVLCEVDPQTFTLDVTKLEALITPQTKAIVPVHLFGHSADIEKILELAGRYGIPVIEDNAQAIGGRYRFGNGRWQSNGTMGLIGTTSFFPSKNLGAYGDGGALFTNDEALAQQLHRIANHGQSKKYIHDCVGCNSRLDTMQAAILRCKLKYLDAYCDARRQVADAYDEAFKNLPGIRRPYRAPYTHHVFHQYTLIIEQANRDEIKRRLQEQGIPSMIYYPKPIYRQQMYIDAAYEQGQYDVTDWLTPRVLSLPIHTEMDEEQIQFIANQFTNILKSLS